MVMWWPSLAILLLWTAVACAVPATSSISSNHSASYEQTAQGILNVASQRMRNIWDMRRRRFQQMTSKGKSLMGSPAPSKSDVERETYKLEHELAANLSVLPAEQLHDPLLRRRVQRLSKLQFQGLQFEDYNEYKNVLRTFQSFALSPMVCLRDDCSNSRALSMYPQIFTQNMLSKNNDHLKLNWFKWRSTINDKDTAKSTFLQYVRLLRKAATYNGHVTPSRTWYLNYDTDNFQAELEAVIWEIMPLYREMHAFLRHSAIQAYPKASFEDDGAITAPVLDQMLSQAWFPHQIFQMPFPKDQLPSVHTRLEEVLVTPAKINKKAGEFFKSLGLHDMSDQFYDRFVRRMNDDEGGQLCKAEVYYFPPDVAMRYCPKPDYKKMMQIHGNMAELQYNIFKRELPFGLDTEPCPGFATALAETAVLASGTPRHLNRLHILYNDSLTENQSVNRLFRMGVHTLLAVPQYYINDRFLADVVDQRIGVQEFNCAYWRLQDKYAGVQPPIRRPSSEFDPDYRFYLGLEPEKSSTRKLLTEILGFQFYRSFCLTSGQYKPGNSSYPLHNCDFFGSDKVGQKMRDMMKLGASKHWRDVMEIGTGERKLSGRGILEYFAPLFTWLKERNAQLELEPGWDAEVLCKQKP